MRNSILDGIIAVLLRILDILVGRLIDRFEPDFLIKPGCLDPRVGDWRAPCPNHDEFSLGTFASRLHILRNCF